MNRLKALRVAAGYDSQRELAAAISQKANGDKSMEVSYASIARLEAGDANPRWNIVNALARFFRVSTDYLMRYEAPVSTSEKEDKSSLPPEIQLMVEDFTKKMLAMYPKDGGVDL